MSKFSALFSPMSK